MPSTVQQIVKKLSPTEGICLRYVVSTEEQPVTVDRLVNHIPWSFLPQTYLEAKATMGSLERAKLVKKTSQLQFTFTDLGKKVVKYADENGLFRKTRTKNPSSRRNHK